MLSWIGNLETVTEKFLFLDRDGILNHDSPDYVKNWEEFQFYPDALSALQWLHRHHVGVIIASNQSALQRGYMTWDNFWHIHHAMIREIRRAGGDILATYYCPHQPQDHCSCRKPSADMLLSAARTFGVVLPSTPMIGDRATDLLAARAAGCRAVWLDRRDSNPGLSHWLDVEGCTPDNRFTSLLEAVQTIYGVASG